ncbi:MAG: nucleotide exchange factor GrpE [Cyanophyceae cyanobacterium]
MTAQEKQPMPPEDAIPELVEEDQNLEELIVEAEASESEPAPVARSGADTGSLSKLQHEADVAKQQLKEREDAYVRLYADFENFRRRTQREKEDISTRERQKILVEILPVVDNFERAKQQVKLDTDREHDIHNSYQSVHRLLVDTLKKLGVSRMKATGQSFDPNIHEAVAHQPSSDFAEGLVAAEYQAGYTIGEVVIRHAMVSVSDGPGPSSEGGEATQEADLTSEGADQSPSPVDQASSTQPNWDSPES